MAAISSLAPPRLLQMPVSPPWTNTVAPLKLASIGGSWTFTGRSFLPLRKNKRLGQLWVVSQEATTVQDPSTEAARRLYVGNIPRSLSSSELASLFGEHGSVEKAEVMYDKYSGRSRRFGFVTMSTVEDANAVIDKMNGSEIGGRQIKVNVTEKPLQAVELSLLQADESNFIDSPFKVYVGNLSRSVTTEILTKFFSGRGKVLSAKVSRVPGTSKSSGFGFVTFSSEEDVEAAIISANNAFLEGQRIRVNKA